MPLYFKEYFSQIPYFASFSQCPIHVTGFRPCLTFLHDNASHLKVLHPISC